MNVSINSNICKSDFKCRNFNKFINIEYECIKQVQNELKKFSDDILSQKVEKDWSGEIAEINHLKKIIMVVNNTARLDKHMDKLQNSPKSKWGKLKNEYAQSMHHTSVNSDIN